MIIYSSTTPTPATAIEQLRLTLNCWGKSWRERYNAGMALRAAGEATAEDIAILDICDRNVIDLSS